MGRILREKQSQDAAVIRKADSGVGGINTKQGGEGRGPLKHIRHLDGQDEKESY